MKSLLTFIFILSTISFSFAAQNSSADCSQITDAQSKTVPGTTSTSSAASSSVSAE